jgi:putative transposase
MPEYRRFLLAGGTFFFTLVTYDRKPIFINPLVRDLLREIWKKVVQKHPFQTEAICLLPDHIHCIWTLPQDNAKFSLRWSEIKRQFTYRYLNEIKPILEKSASRVKRGEASLWQRRFWEHTIRDEVDLNNHINYIHYNPVKHGLVSNVKDWEFSSFHKYVKLGMYTEDWGSGEDGRLSKMDFGE